MATIGLRAGVDILSIAGVSAYGAAVGIRGFCAADGAEESSERERRWSRW